MSALITKFSIIFILALFYYVIGTTMYRAGKQIGLNAMQSWVCSLLGLITVDQFVRTLPSRIGRNRDNSNYDTAI